jgi:hypothetical protein
MLENFLWAFAPRRFEHYNTSFACAVHVDITVWGRPQYNHVAVAVVQKFTIVLRGVDALR